MAKYLTRLWDEYSKTVLANTRDLDARDPNYPELVASTVWTTVDALRTQRASFFKLVRDELARKKRKPSRPPA
jgi:hypothetical protein